MAGHYMVAARSGATAATADHVVACLWNPHATKSIYVFMVMWGMSNATSNTTYHLRRATARGTPGTTVTPGIDNDFDHTAAPISGALLDLAAYLVQPTIDATKTLRGLVNKLAGGGMRFFFMGKSRRIPAGEGLAIAQNAATASVLDVTFWWEE